MSTLHWQTSAVPVLPRALAFAYVPRPPSVGRAAASVLARLLVIGRPYVEAATLHEAVVRDLLRIRRGGLSCSWPAFETSPPCGDYRAVLSGVSLEGGTMPFKRR